MNAKDAHRWDGSWTALLACPACGASLRAIEDTELRCASCARSYPIRSHVPSLLIHPARTELKTQELYDDIWDSYKTTRPSRGYRARASSNIELLKQAASRELVQGKVGIDAGCGDGGTCEFMASQHSDLRFIGIDLAASMRKTAARAEIVPNVRFVQGNLMELPLAKHAFDFIYSFGVLHHTRDPQAAFHTLLERLRPGGLITLFVYKDFSDMPLKRWLLAPVTLARRITTRMPAPLLRAFAWCGAPVVFLTLTLPARFLRALRLERMARHIPYGIFPGIQGIAASLEDRFGVPYEHRFSLANLQEWARAANLDDVRIVDCLPWGFSGLLLSGRTAR